MSTHLRILLTFSVCLGLLVVGSVTFPVSSGAKPQPAQQSRPQTKRKRADFVPGEVLVRYRSESHAKSKSASMRIAALDGTVLPVALERFGGSDLVEGLRLAHVGREDTLKAVAALRRQPDVLYAEPNYILRATATPNDPLLAQQYGLFKIGAPQAWDTRTGSTGSNRVVIGVVDEGIDINHHDLQANIWTNPAEIAGNNIDDDGNGFIDDVHGFNFFQNNGTVFTNLDTESHATHVAGIAGAVGNNNLGVSGVNWSVGLMSLKFLHPNTDGNTATAINACAYARQMLKLWNDSGHTKGANVRILNGSFGGDRFSQSFLDALGQLNTAGILFVAAAGNVDIGTREPNNDLVPQFPASFKQPNVISVAATDDVDALATFTHFGPGTVHLGAPGESIVSTTPPCANPGPATCQPNFPVGFGPTDDTYTSFRGTSMSAPFVSGAAALLWAQNPNLTAQQVKNLLLVNGNIVPALLGKTLTGRRLNVANSLQSLAEGDVTPPGSVGSFHINSQNGRSLNIGWTASGDDGATGNASLYEVIFIDAGGEEFPLKGLIPKSPGALQSVDVNIPYRHTSGTLIVREFDNAGNEGAPASLPVGVPLSAGDPYTISTSANPGLSTGGVVTEIDADDGYVDSILPFAFPFFGSTFTTVTLSSNGAMYFSRPPRRCPELQPNCTDAEADDPPGAPETLGGYKMIAGLWEDLDLRISSRADAGVYVTQPAPGQIVFRWQGVPCNFDGDQCTGGAPVNFEIELNSNGVIRSRYGSNATLASTVGIGGGEQEGYAVASHTAPSQEDPINLTNAPQVTYTPRAQSVSTVQLASAAVNVNEASGFLTVDVNRTGDLASFASVNYSTSDTAGLTNCTTANGKASERCDYETSVGTLRFATGESTKSFIIPIVNDALVEGNETFNITLGGVTGASLGTSNAVVTIVENDTTPANQNPIDDITFFVTQQYIDFLGRLPDSTGLANWVATLSGCPNGGFGEFDNPDCDRVHVSSGFYLSPEFQGRGSFAYRFYEVALDRRPTYAEFVPDMAQVGGPQSPESEALSKAAYTEAWTQRPAFKTKYDGMSDSTYVNTLEANAEVVLPNKAALIAALQNGQKTRGEVLREIVETNSVAAQFFNRAFVSMQYFGYLRRDPDSIGFQNWVNTLNADPSNFRHMIFGFLFSTEYRQRFGP
ncbi:MAG TPA: S8 family serine peptidase [Pyrinomonadaceae bacterium]|nr:S8 family serine peptidase [Pyrinomonadaceae bacterium]